MQNHANKSIKKIAPVAAVAFVATMLVGAFSFTTTAYAAVTFDPATGEGFVGKGDVQRAFGWNNKQLQENAGSVEFQYKEHTRADVTCVGEDKKEVTQTEERNRVSNLNSELDADPRQVKGQKQFTGFILSGFDGDPSGSDNIGEIGDPCSFGPIVNGEITNIQITQQTTELIAIFNGEERTL